MSRLCELSMLPVLLCEFYLVLLTSSWTTCSEGSAQSVISCLVQTVSYFLKCGLIVSILKAVLVITLGVAGYIRLLFTPRASVGQYSTFITGGKSESIL